MNSRAPLLFAICAATLAAQSSADRIVGALEDRALAEQAARMKTDDRISLYSAMIGAKPDNLHYQVLLAGAYVQKTRETYDYSYLDRATTVLNGVLQADRTNYEAQRLLTETLLERHQFAKAAETSRKLIAIDPNDPWNWGTLGDAYIEIGGYDQAADAYQQMMQLRPDLASYNRAAHYRFLFNDVPGAIAIMQRAIQAGSGSPENVAWCLVDLGNIYYKTGDLKQAAQTFTEALRTFSNYHPAYAGLGRVLADQGDVAGAIQNYRHAQQITPMPDYAAALAHLYRQAGREPEAKQQIEMLDVIDRVSRAAGETANRNLVFAFADLDIQLDRALDLAQGEFAFRQDIYSYDALAWALYKNHRYAEALDAMQKAMKLKTPEPSFERHWAAIRAADQQAVMHVTEGSK